MTNVARLKDIAFISSEKKLLIEFEDLIKFLIKNHTDNDSDIKKFNIKRQLITKNGLIEDEGKLVIPFESLIRFISDNYENFEICKTIFGDIIEKLIAKNEVESDKSTYTLYKEIANSNFLKDFESSILKLQIDEDELFTLKVNQKHEFTPIEWYKICIFEHHWQQKNDASYEYEDILTSKFRYWENLKKTKETCHDLLGTCLKNISYNSDRKNAHEELMKESFEHDGIIHCYSRLDSSMLTTIQNLVPLEDAFNIAIVDCLPSICRHSFGVHVFVENGDLDDNDLCTVIRRELDKVHSLYVPEVIFLSAGTLHKYSCKNCERKSFHRFSLRDDYFTKKLAKSIESVSKENNPDECFAVESIKKGGKNYCFHCYEQIKEFIAKPLHWTDFSLLQEWFLTVPLEMQEILTSAFFNSKRLLKTDHQNLDSFLSNKICRLFQLHETGLNILNKNYTGTLQLMNTEELIINHHSVTTVFDITSHSGASQSLKTAERWLQKQADSDRLYFNSYIKKHPLTYRSVDDVDPVLHEISMRDCHVILFMDNLVRLRTHEDPDPGQSRTSQICTLPITLKGLPKDSNVTKLWHSSECEDELPCRCFQPNELSKKDASLLYNLTTDESEMEYKFKSQIQWTSSVHAVDLISQQIFPSPSIHVASEFSTEQEIKELDASMQSFSIEEPDEYNLWQQRLDFDTLNLEEVSDSDVEDAITSEINFIEGIEKLDLTIEDEPDIPKFFDDDLELPSDIEEFALSTTVNPNKESISQDREKNKVIPCEMSQFRVPPLLCRHPEPATGRDDDFLNLKQILYDVLIKLGRYRGTEQPDRILFAPDHKIAKNLIKLIKVDNHCHQFLPEFPVLHLRKSKITNLISAYKNAGILHLLKYMKDEEDIQEWTKLLTMNNIDSATRYIRRLSSALHLAILIQFYKTLEEHQQENFITSFMHGCINRMDKDWGEMLKSFIEESCCKSPVFCLHVDMAKHCDEIVAISLAERIGGKDGYSLLLAAVKSCLPFSFVNGATSYASFCVELLHAHYSAGTFHKRLKETLFSTPHRDSKVNLALDTQREMDHREALKGFRPRSTMDSVIPRMSLVDHFSGVQGVRSGLMRKTKETLSCLNEETNSMFDSSSRIQESDSRTEQTESILSGSSHNATGQSNNLDFGLQKVDKEKTIQVELTDKDMKFVIPVAKMIIRMGALSVDENITLKNVYDPQSPSLSDAILDKHSMSAGEYLIKKYVCHEELFGFKKEDCPDVSSVDCIKEVKNKLKSSKGTTIRISTIRKEIPKSKVEETEKKRKLIVKKKQNVVDCMSSNMNTCQALVKPDCTKGGLQKSTGIKKALIKSLWYTFEGIQMQETEEQLNSLGILCSDINSMPTEMSTAVKIAVYEFAGVKFHAPVSSGKDYLAYVANSVIGKAMRLFPNIRHMIICEEKYSFTPDDLKAETRAKRQNTKNISIAHLKQQEEIVSAEKFSKSAIRGTSQGKNIISTFLAKNIAKLPLNKDLTIDIDSEALLGTCNCNGACECGSYCIPIRSLFTTDNGFQGQLQLNNIKQKKGEAEMAQGDWYLEIQKLVSEGEAVVSIVTSGDIDSVVIHLFALSHYWPRKEDGSFKTSVYILLQKAKPDLYNITEIISRLEKKFGLFTKNIALSLAIGGNDFIPKYYSVSHEKWVTTILDNPYYLQNLAKYDVDDTTKLITNAYINTDIYLDVIKTLYCPASINAASVTLQEVQQMSIKRPGKEIRNPKSWMPPECALRQMAKLVECQIQYLTTIWKHEATLPKFLEKGCLVEDKEGNICYNFGENAKVNDPKEILEMSDDAIKSLMRTAKKRPRSNHGTPTKLRKPKCRPKMSTPRKESQEKATN